MDCNTLKQNLTSLFEDTLDERTHQSFQEHLDQCPECDQHVRVFGSFSNIFRGLALVPVPDDLTIEILERFSPEKIPAGNFFGKFFAASVLFTAAGAAVIYFSLTPPKKTPPSAPAAGVAAGTAAAFAAKKENPPRDGSTKITFRASELEEITKIKRRAQDEREAFEKQLLENIREIERIQKKAADEKKPFGARELEEWLQIKQTIEDKKSGTVLMDLSSGAAKMISGSAGPESQAAQGSAAARPAAPSPETCCPCERVKN